MGETFPSYRNLALTALCVIVVMRVHHAGNNEGISKIVETTPIKEDRM
jgi:hypothetical protein